ncbi:Concanavalin A-like lectin family protein [Raphanus sativus]|uniref:Uncharacterized protein LOC108830237 n=1 Tax=Raphanus sativus TaxID=3726 RepID=A0A6J0LGI6_RAPSA|nr:uncharacterized protein LOC108830237 [Raphanus sativus]KAJ4885231.1 Concanavalin A-like lectin family protein [Raphanus sativus]
MASFMVLLLALTSLFPRISISEATSSFSFTSFDKNASFGSDDIALFGYAKLVDNGVSVQLIDSVSRIGGGVIYKKPIASKDTKDDYFTGFSTVFSFSMSPGRGGSVGFVVFPSNVTVDHSLFEVKFDISDNFTKFKDSNVTVGVYGSTVPDTISNLTVVNYKEKDEEEEMLLYVWINYQASTRYLDARLTKSKGYTYPKTRFGSRINLLKDEDEIMVGVKSYNGSFNLHSWRLQAGLVSRGIHSYAALLESKRRWEEEVEKRRREKMWGTVTCFVMTFGSIGLVFFAMMRIWAAFKRNYLAVVVEPEECGQKTKEYEMIKKVEVVTSKAEAQQGK